MSSLVAGSIKVGAGAVKVAAGPVNVAAGPVNVAAGSVKVVADQLPVNDGYGAKHLGLAVFVGTVITAYAAKSYFAGSTCRSPTLLFGKTVLITGGNTGIGRETALDLARRGARVILACRDLNKGLLAAMYITKESGNTQVYARLLDLASLKSVRQFCASFKESYSRLDILINNAGVMACPQLRSADGFELQFATNHLGHFLLTLELLDLIKASSPSRIINVSAKDHAKGEMNIFDVNFERTVYDPWTAYRQSKLANVLFTVELAKRLQGSGVSVFALHPGVVDTDLRRHASAPRWLLSQGRRLLMKTPEQGAQTTIYCAVTEGLEEETGKYFSECGVSYAKNVDPDVASQLWALSTHMAGMIALSRTNSRM